jgi:hypothetical protein
MLGVEAQKAYDVACKYDRSIKATDPRLCRMVIIRDTDEMTSMVFDRAFVVVYKAHYLVFTEHQGFHVFDRNTYDVLQLLRRVIQPLDNQRAFDEDPPGPWPGEMCRRCGKRNTVGFTVSDELWTKVVGDPHTVRCLTCFDEEAQEKGVRYTGQDILEFYPVSWSDWEDDDA